MVEVFKLSPSLYFQSADKSFTIPMVKDLSDDDLMELANHLEVQFPSGISRYHREPGRFRLFISHISAHKVEANELKASLDAFCIDGFVAHEDLEPTTEWQDEIESALWRSDALVALIHEGFSESRWTDQEVGFALGRGLKVLPVRCGKDPYGFIGKYQGIPGNGGDMRVLAGTLFDLLAASAQTKRSLGLGIGYALRHSSSFDGTRTACRLLKSGAFDLSLLDLKELIRASFANPQVSRCDFGGSPAPDFLERLLA